MFPGTFLKSGRPRGPGEALKNVGGLAYRIFEGFPGPPGAGQTSKMNPKNFGQTAFSYPVVVFTSEVHAWALLKKKEGLNQALIRRFNWIC